MHFFDRLIERTPFNLLAIIAMGDYGHSPRNAIRTRFAQAKKKITNTFRHSKKQDLPYNSDISGYWITQENIFVNGKRVRNFENNFKNLRTVLALQF